MPALVGGIVGMASYAIQSGYHFSWSGMGDAFAWGMISGAASFGVGQVAGAIGGSSAIATMGLQAAGHGLTQGGISYIQGGSFWQGAATGAVSSIIAGGASRIGGDNTLVISAVTLASGGVSGGLTSMITGGDFWDGAKTGLIVAGLNHSVHLIQNMGAKFFSSEGKAFDYMMKQHNKNGKEQACYILDDGIIVLPSDEGGRYSYPWKDFLHPRKTNGKFSIKYNGKSKYPIGFLHTHPNEQGIYEGFIGDDVSQAIYTGKPSFIWTMGKNTMYSYWNGQQFKAPFNPTTIISNPEYSIRSYIYQIMKAY